MEVQNLAVNMADGAELDQAADALVTMGLKAEKMLAGCKDLGQIFPLASRQEPTGDPPKADAANKAVPELAQEENHPPPKHVACSACMKCIQNPLSDGHGIVDGHVGQFRMLIPWVKEADGNGILCSRCYQRNWRLNKQQRTGSDDQNAAAAEAIPREPYKCLCGMTFQSSQLKAAHCRLCQKYRDVADQEQRQEGPHSTALKPSTKDSAQKRPRPSSELEDRHLPHPEERRDPAEGPLTTPAARIHGLNNMPSPVSSFAGMTTPLVMSSPLSKTSSSGGSGNTNAVSLNSQKLQLVQLLQTTRLLGQVVIVQYANLADMVSATTDPDILSEVSQLVLQFALRPLVYSQQFLAAPPAKMACFDGEARPMSSLSLFPSVFKLPSEYEARTLLQAMK